MKSKLSRLLSMLLVLCMLLSSFAIFVSADDSGSTDESAKENVKVGINRTFDEGWDYTNGIAGALKGGIMKLNYERRYDLSYNYYFYVECTTPDNEFITFNAAAGGASEGYAFMEFDFKTSENCLIGSMIEGITTGNDGSRNFCEVLGFKNGDLVVMGQTIPKSQFSVEGDEWIHISFVFDYDFAKRNQYVPDVTEYDYQTTVICTKEDGTQAEFNIRNTNDNAKKFGFGTFRIGYASASGTTAAQRTGQWWAIDNFKMYSGTDQAIDDLDPETYGYGQLVDETQPRNYPLLGRDASTQSREEILATSLFMKVGVDHMLFNEKRVPILQNYDNSGNPVGAAYGAPRKHTDAAYEGKIMIPLAAVIDYIGCDFYEHEDEMSYDISTGDSVTYLTIGRNMATVGGQQVELSVPAQVFEDENKNKYPVIALDDVEALFPGIYVTYDAMNFFALSRSENIFHRDSDLNWMVSIMKMFVFEFATAEQIYNDVKENTNNFEHPYLFVNQDKFNKLRATYHAAAGTESYDATLRGYMQTFVAQADRYLNASYVDKDANGNFVGFNTHPFISVFDGWTPDGYSPSNGGRWSAEGTICEPLVKIAFAYQVTGDINYALFVYEWILLLGELAHWGPAHFLNTAVGTQAVAIAIDWIYPAFKDSAERPMEALVKILYTHGVYQGYRVSFNYPMMFPSELMGSGQTHYPRATSNWNAVCSSGMIIGALITMECESFPDDMGDKYVDWNQCRETSLKLIENNFYGLCNYGLEQYAPDGSYVESASYWSYGTQNLFMTIICLDSAAGTEYGLMRAWGLDKTCYFALNIEDSNGFMWGYHDGGSGASYDRYGFRVQPAGLSGHFFTWIGQYTGDYDLCRLRRDQLVSGRKPVQIYDCLFYEYFLEGDVELDVQYHMEGIDAYVIRSSWDKNAMYVGLMGGDNSIGHGNLDIGNFIYHNKGVLWITDLGSDNYNSINYFSDYGHYKRNAEGNNVLFIDGQSSIPYGQDKSANAPIVETYDNEYGAYAIVDTLSAYPSFLMDAKRGVLVTNNRETTVIQDEAHSLKFQTMYWIAHFDQRELDSKPEISEDGRTVWMTATSDDTAEVYTLRISLVSKNADDKFILTDTYSDETGAAGGILDATYVKDYHLQLGGQAEYDRSNYGRLVIKKYGFAVEMAIVMEVVDREQNVPVGYEFTPMAKWSAEENLPHKDTRFDSVEEVLYSREVPSMVGFRNSLYNAERFSNPENKLFGTQYTTGLVDYYRYVTDVRYHYNGTKKQLTQEQIASHDLLIAKYQSFLDLYNGRVDSITTLVNKMSGNKAQ